MQFNAGDYARDTASLNLEQHGAYLLLIMEYFNTGNPLKEDKIPHILRINRIVFQRKIRPFIQHFFYIIGDDWFHKRVEKELQRIEDKSKSAKKSVGARWDHGNTNVSTDVIPRARVLEPEPLEKERIMPVPASPKPAPSEKRKRNSYPESFEQFWSEYPKCPNAPKTTTFSQWQKLEDIDQQRALAGLSGFKAYCRKNPTYTPVWPERYLSQRRFDNFLPDASPQLKLVASDGPKELIRYPGSPGIERERVAKLIADWKADPSNWPVVVWGPRPDDPCCQFFKADLIACGLEDDAKKKVVAA